MPSASRPRASQPSTTRNCARYRSSAASTSSSTAPTSCRTRSSPVASAQCTSPDRSRTLPSMRLEDMILISVDDHIVEPPDVFEKHLPAKYRDIAPRIERKPDGTDKWHFLDFDIPNVGLNAVAG